MKRFLLLLSFWLCSVPAWGAEGYYRFPALHGDRLYFTAEGDLWSVGVSGGVARRLTSHAEEEIHPRPSPDGTLLAFSASYEGPTEVYTMPVEGGLPVRRTFEPAESIVVGWTPDGRLLYRTSQFSTLPNPELVALDLENHRSERIPLTPAGAGVYDSTGETLYFESPAFHRNNTKRYQGGTARNIWKYTAGQGEAVNLTGDFPGEDHSPMWWQGRVYFVCDRDGNMNIWSMDPEGGDLRQHTYHRGWDVLHPSLDQGRIAYQVGADLWMLQMASGANRRIEVTLSSDFDQLREKWVKDPMEYLTSLHLSPDGTRVAATTRGRVFVLPVKGGRLVQVTRQPGVRYRDAVFLPDGESLLALSDVSGELEFWRLPANGVGNGQALTSDGTILRFQGHPSPDGKWVAHADKNNDLWVLEVESGRQIRVSAGRDGVGEMAWSPDSRWLAYTEVARNTYVQIHLYRPQDSARKEVTSNRVNSRYPAWSPDGQFLYFVSDRNLESLVRSPWGPRQPEAFFDKSMKIYELALRRGSRSPFQPPDELSPKRETEAKEAAETPQVQIDLEGLELRLREVPAKPGNYGDLLVNADALFFLDQERGSPGSKLLALKIAPETDEPKPVELADRVGEVQLSADGKKLLARQRDVLYVLDAKASKPAKLEDHKLDLQEWKFSLNVREDFRQLFVDAWRLERDYFYDPAMHGLDWNAMLQKYLPLVERVTTRGELSDLIGQLVGELSALHVSVRGGDHREGPDQIELASLGARLVRSPGAGGYRIDYVYRSDPDYPNERSPLADPELDIRAGDVIHSVNGVSTLEVDDIGALLRNQKGRQVLLRLARGEATRDLVVKPLSADEDRDLRYRDWQFTRRLHVEERGQGQLGYLHLQAMGSDNLTEWYRNFYPVFDRPGLIVDVRHNRGGNIDSLILEKLLRRAWFYWQGRTGQPFWNMQYAFRGHMVVLVDELTASDGEAFAEGFRRLGLGPVIGVRTWGGEIWLSSNNRLTDRGYARAPQLGVYGPEGEWLIEGHGVVPDLEVRNLPHATFQGGDAQLDAAVDYLLERIAQDPREVPPPPPFPDKSFDYEGAPPAPATSGQPGN